MAPGAPVTASTAPGVRIPGEQEISAQASPAPAYEQGHAPATASFTWKKWVKRLLPGPLRLVAIGRVTFYREWDCIGPAARESVNPLSRMRATSQNNAYLFRDRNVH